MASAYWRENETSGLSYLRCHVVLRFSGIVRDIQQIINHARLLPAFANHVQYGSYASYLQSKAPAFAQAPPRSHLGLTNKKRKLRSLARWKRLRMVPSPVGVAAGRLLPGSRVPAQCGMWYSRQQVESMLTSTTSRKTWSESKRSHPKKKKKNEGEIPRRNIA